MGTKPDTRYSVRSFAQRNVNEITDPENAAVVDSVCPDTVDAASSLSS